MRKRRDGNNMRADTMSVISVMPQNLAFFTDTCQLAVIALNAMILG
ncbi:hypothetical protein ACQKMI_00085 [Lysinibacillus sp. NPDC097214]